MRAYRQGCEKRRSKTMERKPSVLSDVRSFFVWLKKVPGNRWCTCTYKLGGISGILTFRGIEKARREYDTSNSCHFKYLSVIYRCELTLVVQRHINIEFWMLNYSVVLHHFWWIITILLLWYNNSGLIFAPIILYKLLFRLSSAPWKKI